MEPFGERRALLGPHFNQPVREMVLGQEIVKLPSLS